MLSALMLVPANVCAAENDQKNSEVIVEAKPDVIVEVMSFLMPHTVQRSMGFLNTIGYETFAGKLLKRITDSLPSDSQFAQFDLKGTVYSPYLDEENQNYPQTTLYKMFKSSGEDNLSLLKEYNFERVLGVFNYIMFFFAMGFVALAAMKLAWVSMTVEDESKAWRKLVIIIPSISIAVVLITPMSDLNGINLVQVIFVLAVLIGNALASSFSLIVSLFLFNHVIETTPEYSDGNEGELLHSMADESTKSIIGSIVTEVNSRLLAEVTMSQRITEFLGGEPLTNANLSAAIDTYNLEHKFVGENAKYQLTPRCFAENWMQDLKRKDYESAACVTFLKSDYLAYTFSTASNGDNNYKDSVDSIVELGGNGKGTITSSAIREAISQNTGAITNVFDSMYLYQKESYCARKASLGGMGGSADIDEFKSSFICQKRSGGDFSSTEFYGAVASGGSVTPSKTNINIKYLYDNIYSVFVNVSKLSVINNISFKPRNENVFYLRGFFISPLESVMSAIMYLNKNSNSAGEEERLALASAMGQRVIVDAISDLYPARVDLDAGAVKYLSEILPNSFSLDSEVATMSSAYKSKKFTELAGVIFSKDDRNLENIKMKVIEPYSHMQNTYTKIFPMAMGLLVGSAGLKIYEGEKKGGFNVGFKVVHGMIGFLGGVLFLLSMFLKLLVGVLFLYSAISLVMGCLKRFIVLSIAATLMSVRSLKENFNETGDDEENVTISKYVISSFFRLSVDFVMVTVAIVGSYVIGTIAANIMAYTVLMFGATIGILSEEVSVATYMTEMLFLVFINVAICWGVYQGIKMMSYIYDKTTDFIDDPSDIKASNEQHELLTLVKSSLMPTAYVK